MQRNFKCERAWSDFTERDEIVGERGAELSGAVCCDFERWSWGANTHVSGEREFSPLTCSGTEVM